MHGNTFECLYAAERFLNIYALNCIRIVTHLSVLTNAADKITTRPIDRY